MTGGAFEHELPRNHDAPWLARRLLGQWFGAELESDELHRAKLLTSELVTNAVLHGRGRIVLRAELDDLRALIEVLDGGPGFEPDARRGDVRGRGLGIVDSESSRWGVRAGTTHVWFELKRSLGGVRSSVRPAN